MATDSFYAQCLANCAAIWEEAAEHPFVQGLSSGTLNNAQLLNYLVQDGLYLQNYIRVCRILAEKSQTESDRALFLESATLSEEAELSLQSSLAKTLSLGWENQEPWPATAAYMDHERNAAEDTSALVGLAAATPCTTLYAEIGKRLSERTDVARANHPFRAWLDLYSDPFVQELSSRWVACLDCWASSATPEELEKAKSSFAESIHCEAAFWEQAWRSG